MLSTASSKRRADSTKTDQSPRWQPLAAEGRGCDCTSSRGSRISGAHSELDAIQQAAALQALHQERHTRPAALRAATLLLAALWALLVRLRTSTFSVGGVAVQ